MGLMTRFLITCAAALFPVFAQASWSQFDIRDEFGDPTGNVVARSSALQFQAGQHAVACHFIVGGKRAGMQCSYLNLVGSWKDSLTGTTNYRLRTKLAGRKTSFVAFTGGIGGKTIYFERAFRSRLLKAIERGEQDDLVVVLPYFSAGQVPVRIPLSGLEELLVQLEMLQAGSQAPNL